MEINLNKVFEPFMLDEASKYVVLSGGMCTGKFYAAVAKMIKYCMGNNGRRALIVADELSYVKSIIGQLLGNGCYDKINNRCVFVNGSVIYLQGKSNCNVNNRHDVALIKGADYMNDIVFNVVVKHCTGQIIMTCNKPANNHWLRHVANYKNAMKYDVGSEYSYLGVGLTADHFADALRYASFSMKEFNNQNNMKKYTIEDLRTNENLFVYCKTKKQWKELRKIFPKNIASEKWLGSNYYCFNDKPCSGDKIKIAFEQVDFSEFTLPKNWCVEITEENKAVLLAWAKAHDNFNGSVLFKGYIMSDSMWDGTYLSYLPNNEYTEITFDQFKKHVLPLGVVGKNGSKIHFIEISDEEAKALKGKNTNVAWIDDAIKITDDCWSKLLRKIKEESKSDKKLIGYKLKENCKQYEFAVNALIGRSCDYSIDDLIEKEKDIDTLFEAGVLDLWFDAVYKEKPKRWRADEGKEFYFINDSGEVVCDTEHNTESDNEVYEYGNYFQTKQEAESVAKRFKALLDEHHK